MKLLKALKLKPLDFVVIIGLFLLSFSPWLMLTTSGNTTGVPTAVLRVAGDELKSFNLSENQTYTYEDPDGDINVIEVKNGKIGITYANCADQLCVRKGFVSKVGDTIACLPHKLVIEVVSGETRQDDTTSDNGGQDY
jgi:hypothetical protein